MNVDLSGPELAEHLAIALTDLEFELLIRTRIKRAFNMAHTANAEFYEGHNACRFTFEWNDKCDWYVSLGASYKDQVCIHGEVLSTTVLNCEHQWNLQHNNKLSLLLSAPVESDNNVGF